MADKKLTLQIGGKDIVLNYGSNWFFEHYKKDSGHDLVKDPGFSEVDITGTGLFGTVCSLIWAGHSAECSLNKKATDVARHEVVDHVMSGDINTVGEMLWKIIAAISGVSVEDLKAKTQEEEKKSQIQPGTI